MFQEVVTIRISILLHDLVLMSLKRDLLSGSACLKTSDPVNQSHTTPSATCCNDWLCCFPDLLNLIDTMYYQSTQCIEPYVNSLGQHRKVLNLNLIIIIISNTCKFVSFVFAAKLN